MKLSTAFYYLGMIFPISLVQIPVVGEIFPLLIILLSTLLVLSNPKISPLAIYIFSAVLVVAYYVSIILSPSVSWIFVFQQCLLLCSYLFIYSCSHVRSNSFYLQKFGRGFLKVTPIVTLFALASFVFEWAIRDISGFGAYLGHPVVHGFLGEPKQFAGFMIAALVLEYFRSNSFSIYRVKVDTRLIRNSFNSNILSEWDIKWVYSLTHYPVLEKSTGIHGYYWISNVGIR